MSLQRVKAWLILWTLISRSKGTSLMTISARYFDGKSSRLYQVEFDIQNQFVTVWGDVERQALLNDLTISEKVSYAPRRLVFADGAFLEVLQHQALNDLLTANGYQDSFVVKLQRNWTYALSSVAFMVAVVILSYTYVLPVAAQVIANRMPPQFEKMIGSNALDFLDGHLFEPSQLNATEQQKITALFKGLKNNKQDDIELLFRKSKIGPNAFALPSRQIIVTDEIVHLLNNDQQLMGVLGHELGHLEHRHFTRRLIQTSLVGAGSMALFGDISSVVAGIPTLLLDLKYSRDIETNADDYAIQLFKKHNIALENFAQTFEALGKISKGNNPPPYLSSHPVTEERIAHIRAAEKK